MVHALKSLRLLCVVGAIAASVGLLHPMSAEAATRKPAKTAKAAKKSAVAAPSARNSKSTAKRRVVLVDPEPVRASFGQMYGLHKVQDRPVAVGGQVVVRPMMYVALTYDHRLIDGQQAVLFLVRVKELMEDPAAMLIA